jgi:hypothetical protein
MIQLTSKTTILGVITIIAAIANAALSFLQTGSLGDVGQTIALITGGFGLIKAADSK